MPRYFRLDSNGDPVEHPEDNDEALDPQRVRWLRWMQMRGDRVRHTTFRGGSIIIETTFRGLTREGEQPTDPNWPAIFRVKIFGAGLPPAVVRHNEFVNSRAEVVAAELRIFQFLVARGILNPGERPD